MISENFSFFINTHSKKILVKGKKEWHSGETMIMLVLMEQYL
jgi:hypothetical protein